MPQPRSICCRYDSRNEPDIHNTMDSFAQYTFLYAPMLYLVSGIFIVILLSKFIGKTPGKK